MGFSFAIKSQIHLCLIPPYQHLHLTWKASTKWNLISPREHSILHPPPGGRAERGGAGVVPPPSLPRDVRSWKSPEMLEKSASCARIHRALFIYLEIIRLKPKQQDIVIKVSRLSRYLFLFSSCSCYRHDQLLNTKCDGPVVDKWGWLGKQIRLIWSTSSAYYKIWSK